MSGVIAAYAHGWNLSIGQYGEYSVTDMRPVFSTATKNFQKLRISTEPKYPIVHDSNI